MRTDQHRGTVLHALGAALRLPTAPRSRRLGRLLAPLLCALACVVPAAWAQKTTRIVVPYAPGGTLDVLARQLAVPLAQALGETVVVENLPGGNGINATKQLAAAAPDGHTLMLASTSQLAVNYHVSRGALSFDPGAMFQVLGTISKVPHVLVVRANTLPNWKAIEAKCQSPAGVSYGTAGVGSTNHLTGALLAEVTGLKLNHVPYRGSGAALSDLLGGHIDMMVDQVPTSLPHVQAGRFKAIAVTSAARLPSLPDTPTLKEIGLAVDPVVAWNAIVAPRKIPPERATQLRAAVEAASQSPEFVRAVAAAGAVPWRESSTDADRFVQSENARWSALIRSKNIQVE